VRDGHCHYIGSDPRPQTLSFVGPLQAGLRQQHIFGPVASSLLSTTERRTALFEIFGADGSLVYESTTAHSLRDAVSEAIAVGVSLEYAILAMSDLTGMDLSRANLRNTILSGSDLSHCNLAGADLSGATLMRVTPREVAEAIYNFMGIEDPVPDSHVKVQATNLSGADLTGASVRDAAVEGVNFSGAILRGVDLKVVKGEMYGVNLSRTDLSGKKLTFINMMDASFSEANLVGTDFSRSTLAGADFSGADLTNSNLSHAYLTAAKDFGEGLPPAKFSGAVLTGADLTGANLTGCDLTDADLTDAVLTDTMLNDATLPAAMNPGPEPSVSDTLGPQSTNTERTNMPSDQFNSAHREMQALVDAFVHAAESSKLARAEDALAAASPEARMMFWSNSTTVMMGLRPDSPESIQEQVSHLMNGGKATLNDLRADIESMSVEGQEHALYLLTHHSAEGVRQIGGVLESVMGLSGASLPATATPPPLGNSRGPEQAATGASKNSGGCYVATAIYGSYDCPEVRVLRRFRDQYLGRSFAGRLTIRAYYATSPAALRVAGRLGSPAFRPPVERLVSVLRSRGYSDEPYEDPAAR
jgi:uncharacterized protein YjbI with pentapeptide repeats